MPDSGMGIEGRAVSSAPPGRNGSDHGFRCAPPVATRLSPFGAKVFTRLSPSGTKVFTVLDACDPTGFGAGATVFFASREEIDCL